MNIRSKLRVGINYVPAALTFLSGTAAIIGGIPNVSSLLFLSSNTAAVLEHAGEILFVVSLVWTVGIGASRLAKLSDLYGDLSKKVREFSEQEHYGHAIQDLQELSKNKEHHGTVEAVSNTALHIAAKVSRGLTPSIRRYCEGAGGCMDIEENYVISNILESLSISSEALPEGSMWLGISKLGAGWKERARLDSCFNAFDQNLCRLASDRKITVFRIYCAPRRDQSAVSDHARTYQSDGVQQHFLAQDEVGMEVPDISIVLRRRRSSSDDMKRDPIAALDDYERLYAIRFEVPSGIIVQKMTFIAPEDPAFGNMVTKFRNAWARSRPISLDWGAAGSA